MRRSEEPLLPVDTILWLQTTCGNRVVQRLLARKAAERRLLAGAANVSARRWTLFGRLWAWFRRVIRWLMSPSLRSGKIENDCR